MATAHKRVPRSVPAKKLPAVGPLTLNTYEAEAQFSHLLDRVMHGEEILIARDGEPIARLAPIVRNRLTDILGRDQGKLHIPDDFNDPMDWVFRE